VVVVCTGGGGIPVVEMPGSGLRGVEAVIDKDLAASLLAREIAADALLLLTDVDAVYLDWSEGTQSSGRRPACPLGRCTPELLRGRDFAAGSMGPKVEAACRFIESGGASAGIGRLEDAEAILAGRVGTRVEAEARR
jgi:carbamate kinase